MKGRRACLRSSLLQVFGNNMQLSIFTSLNHTMLTEPRGYCFFYHSYKVLEYGDLLGPFPLQILDSETFTFVLQNFTFFTPKSHISKSRSHFSLHIGVLWMFFDFESVNKVFYFISKYLCFSISNGLFHL